MLEQKDGPQFIFGLDMLRRHQCSIDLAANVLRFGSCDASLPFLGSHDIPKDFSRHIENVRRLGGVATCMVLFLECKTCVIKLPFLGSHDIPRDFSRHIENVCVLGGWAAWLRYRLSMWPCGIHPHDQSPLHGHGMSRVRRSLLIPHDQICAWP